MKVVLGDLPLNADLKTALLTESGRLGKIYALIQAVESGSWKMVTTLCAEMQLAEDFVASSYWDAMGWAHAIAIAA